MVCFRISPQKETEKVGTELGDLVDRFPFWKPRSCPVAWFSKAHCSRIFRNRKTKPSDMDLHPQELGLGKQGGVGIHIATPSPLGLCLCVCVLSSGCKFVCARIWLEGHKLGASRWQVGKQTWQLRMPITTAFLLLSSQRIA